MKTFQEIPEESTARLTGLFKDEAGVVIGSAQMTGIVGTLYDKATGMYFERNALLETFNKILIWPITNYEYPPTLDASGNFVLILGPRQNKVITPGMVGSELHILLLEWTYSGGSQGKEEFAVPVRNIAKVP